MAFARPLIELKLWLPPHFYSKLKLFWSSYSQILIHYSQINFVDWMIVGSNPSLAIFLYNDKKNVVRGKGSILSDVKQKPWDSRLDK